MPNKKRNTAIPEGGMSDYQIAKRLGITRARVYQIRMRAMQKLYRFAMQDPELAREFTRILQKDK